MKNGSIYINEDYFKGLEYFAKASDELSDSPLYRNDLEEMAAHYLGGKAEILTKMIDQEYLLGDTLQALQLQKRFEHVLTSMDSLLSQHPTLTLNRWLDFAAEAAKTDEQKKQYEMNARRIVTIWGPPVDDYAARIWSGLIKNYYLKRWQNYYASRQSGQPFDMAAWERNWVENNQDAQTNIAPFDVVGFAKARISQTKDISDKDLKLNRKNMIGIWSTNKGKKKEFIWNVPAQMLKDMKGISIEHLKGNQEITVSGFTLEADGKTVASSNLKKTIGKGCTGHYEVNLPEGLKANNSCILKMQINGEGSCGGILFLQP